MAITMQRDGQRIYLVGNTFPIKDRIKAIGGHWDGDRREWWVGVAKAGEAESLVGGSTVQAAANSDAPRQKQDPDGIRLTGKGQHKGRSYYVGSSTRDGQRVRLLTLPDAKGEFLDFWANAGEVQMTKHYTPQRRFAGYGRGNVEVYMTLGRIADFIAESRKADQAIARGEVPDGYCRDLEDGGIKRRSECDMPEN